jgi:nitrogenase molybdenum-iron protein alpha chain
MDPNVRNSVLGTREDRLGTIITYNGNFNDLVSKTNDGTLKEAGRCFSQGSSCPSQCAVSGISSIRDVLVINHGPSGCAANAGTLANGTRLIVNSLGVKVSSSGVIGTDMDENDTVFGASESLKEIVLKAYNRHKPSAIAIAASCVSGIIGEDLDSIIDELKEEIPIPILPLHCEGFKSQVWASGFDIIDNAVFNEIVKPPKEKRNVINVKNFSQFGRKVIDELFERLGIKPLYIYRNATIEELSHLSESLATVSMCETLGSYIGSALQEKYGVPYINSITPNGIVGFETWLREIGKVIKKENEIEDYIKEQREIYIPKIEKAKNKLMGKKVVIGMGPGLGWDTVRLVQELGMEIQWTALWHYDKEHDDGQVPKAVQYLNENNTKNFNVSISHVQGHELSNILNRYKPDLFITRHVGATAFAVKQGIPTYFMQNEYIMFVYKHTLEFANSLVDRITNKSFVRNLAKNTKLPYKEWWFEQDNDLFQGVKEA